jgi:hypothetical protein
MRHAASLERALGVSVRQTKDGIPKQIEPDPVFAGGVMIDVGGCERWHSRHAEPSAGECETIRELSGVQERSGENR